MQRLPPGGPAAQRLKPSAALAGAGAGVMRRATPSQARPTLADCRQLRLAPRWSRQVGWAWPRRLHEPRCHPPGRHCWPIRCPSTTAPLCFPLPCQHGLQHQPQGEGRPRRTGAGQCHARSSRAKYQCRVAGGAGGSWGCWGRSRRRRRRHAQVLRSQARRTCSSWHATRSSWRTRTPRTTNTRANRHCRLRRSVRPRPGRLAGRRRRRGAAAAVRRNVAVPRASCRRRWTSSCRRLLHRSVRRCHCPHGAFGAEAVTSGDGRGRPARQRGGAAYGPATAASWHGGARLPQWPAAPAWRHRRNR